jgi:predicted nucleotidyltransferase
MGIAERWKRFRELPPDISQTLERLIPLFRRKGVLLAYLFGSLGQEKKAQDVDLAILTQGDPAFRLREEIGECLGTERLDLVDLRNASPVLRFEVIRTGRPLFISDEKALNDFELETLHLYRDTAPLRHRQRGDLKRRMAQWSSDGKPLKSA